MYLPVAAIVWLYDEDVVEALGEHLLSLLCILEDKGVGGNYRVNILVVVLTSIADDGVVVRTLHTAIAGLLRIDGPVGILEEHDDHASRSVGAMILSKESIACINIVVVAQTSSFR